MAGKKFLEKITENDAIIILEALGQYRDNTLIDRWVSVKLIATEAKKE